MCRVGNKPPYDQSEHWSLEDNIGSRVALRILRIPQMTGKHSSSRQEFDSIRKLRALLSHLYEISAGDNSCHTVVKGKRERFNTYFLVLHSLCSLRFIERLLAMTSRDTKSDLALDHRISKFTLKKMDDEIINDDTSQ